MKTSFRFALASLIIFGSGLLYAEEKSAEPEKVTLTIDQAVEYALENSKSLKSSAIDLEIAKRAGYNGWNVLLPDLKVSGTMTRDNEFSPSTAALSQLSSALSQLIPGMPKTEAQTNFSNEEDRWNTVGAVTVGWNFSVAMIEQIREAKIGYENGKLTWEQSQRKIETQIKKLFYKILLEQDSLKIKKNTLENSKNRANQADINYRNGTVPELALLQAQVSYQNMIPDVEKAELEIEQDKDSFALLIGIPVGTKIELQGEIEPVYVDVETDYLLSNYGSQNLDIRSLQGNIDSLKAKLSALNLSTWTPALAVNYGWQPAYVGEDGAWHFIKDLGKDDKWYDSGKLSLTLAWNATNMLPWSKNRQNAKDLKANIEKLELKMDMALENQKKDVKKAVDTLNLARAQIDAMGRNVTLAQRAYDMTMRSYRNGATELLDVRDAETSLNQAKLGQISQKFNYISALMDLEDALNTDLTSKRLSK